jgi:hypothetical protein
VAFSVPPGKCSKCNLQQANCSSHLRPSQLIMLSHLQENNGALSSDPNAKWLFVKTASPIDYILVIYRGNGPKYFAGHNSLNVMGFEQRSLGRGSIIIFFPQCLLTIVIKFSQSVVLIFLNRTALVIFPIIHSLGVIIMAKTLFIFKMRNFYETFILAQQRAVIRQAYMRKYTVTWRMKARIVHC